MKKLLISAVSFVALALAGCSEPKPYDQTHNGTLEDSDPRVPDDNSPYDEYTFEAGEGWTITAEMRSDQFDTFLWLFGPNGQALQQHDDISENDTNSRVEQTAPTRGTYRVRCNSYDGSGRGAYTVHITARPPSGS